MRFRLPRNRTIAAVAALTGLALFVPATEAADRVPPQAPASGSGTPTVNSVWDATRFSTGSNSWIDLPGAAITDSTGQTVGYDGVFVVHFDADALCTIPGSDNAVCSVRILVGDKVGRPGDTNARFVTARGNPEWSAHGYTRTVCLPGQFEPRDATTKVQVLASTNAVFELQNWHLVVNRYPVRPGTSCP
ncbi:MULTISPECIES: hypothetical protein [unclassified Kitasatospora]|uniref:hypothetical protein n=1 Tax=unclassified Kitasatospora TaxID=2633591 RepID=UPI00070C1D9F|nr:MULTISPECIES: hypothetical protein [unclassified Kitasatospora]KQV03274.1 hypothetical protein ASC99_15765 [Kitasatospora sp. Root107]